MKEAMERYGVSSGSLNSALTYGYSAGGYHFYRADEPKPDFLRLQGVTANILTLQTKPKTSLRFFMTSHSPQGVPI